MKTGLVLEGGAMRGLFTAGVLDVFMENGISFDGMVGVSAGACFGCNFKSRQIGRSIRYNLKYCDDPRYCSLHSLFSTGDLYGKNFCYYEIPFHLDLFDAVTFEKNPTAFYVVATDIATGKAVYHRIDRVDDSAMEWVRASASMPLAAQPVKIGDREFLDGGITDSIPLRFFEHKGYDRNVVVLTQPKNYQKKHRRTKKILKRIFHDMPEIGAGLDERPDMYNRQLAYVAEREAAGDIFVIRPPRSLDIGHIEHDPDKILEVYEIGRRTAQYHLSQVKSFLRR